MRVPGNGRLAKMGRIRKGSIVERKGHLHACIQFVDESARKRGIRREEGWLSAGAKRRLRAKGIAFAADIEY
jgi:hypothetical protein